MGHDRLVARTLINGVHTIHKHSNIRSGAHHLVLVGLDEAARLTRIDWNQKLPTYSNQAHDHYPYTTLGDHDWCMWTMNKAKQFTDQKGHKKAQSFGQKSTQTFPPRAKRNRAHQPKLGQNPHPTSPPFQHAALALGTSIFSDHFDRQCGLVSAVCLFFPAIPFDPFENPFRPSVKPSVAPSKAPTKVPTRAPSQKPSVKPSVKPTASPSRKPTKFPSSRPTSRPTVRPTSHPTATPTSRPTSR